MKKLGRVALAVLTVALLGWAQAKPEKATAEVLKAPEVQKLMPAAFFYAGQTAPVQLRNSGGVRSDRGKIVLAGLVDSSGYSTAIAEKYQGCLITDAAVFIGDKELKAGAYGIGSLAKGNFVVTDLSGSVLLTVTFANDAAMKRPMPLQFTAADGGFRLYLGRKYVRIEVR